MRTAPKQQPLPMSPQVRTSTCTSAVTHLYWLSGSRPSAQTATPPAEVQSSLSRYAWPSASMSSCTHSGLSSQVTIAYTQCAKACRVSSAQLASTCQYNNHCGHDWEGAILTLLRILQLKNMAVDSTSALPQAGTAVCRTRYMVTEWRPEEGAY